MHHLSLRDFELLLITEKQTSISLPTYDNHESELCISNDYSEYDSTYGIENFFKHFCPNISFIDYMDIREKSKRNERSYCSDPSNGDNTTYREEYIPVSFLYEELVNKNIIKKSLQNTLKQGSGFTLDIFEKALKDIYKDTSIEVTNQQIICRDKNVKDFFSSYMYSKGKEKNLDDMFQDFLLKNNAISKKKEINFFRDYTASYSSHAGNINDVLSYNSYNKKDHEKRANIINLYVAYTNRLVLVKDFSLPDLLPNPKKEQKLEL